MERQFEFATYKPIRYAGGPDEPAPVGDPTPEPEDNGTGEAEDDEKETSIAV